MRAAGGCRVCAPECGPPVTSSPTAAFPKDRWEQSSSRVLMRCQLQTLDCFQTGKPNSVLSKPPFSELSFKGVNIIYLPLFHSVSFACMFLVPFSVPRTLVE